MIRKGYVAAFAALLLLFGHLIIFLQVSKLPVSDQHITDISQLLYPITGASLVSAVLFVIRQQHERLADTEHVNWLFGIFVAVIPTVVISYMSFSLHQVSSSDDVEALRSTIATGETFFGGVFVLIVDAVFGERKAQGVGQP